MNDVLDWDMTSFGRLIFCSCLVLYCIASVYLVFLFIREIYESSSIKSCPSHLHLALQRFTFFPSHPAPPSQGQDKPPSSPPSPPRPSQMHYSPKTVLQNSCRTSNSPRTRSLQVRSTAILCGTIVRVGTSYLQLRESRAEVGRIASMVFGGALVIRDPILLLVWGLWMVDAGFREMYSFRRCSKGWLKGRIGIEQVPAHLRTAVRPAAIARSVSAQRFARTRSRSCRGAWPSRSVRSLARS
jgi:hypothetical protein